MPPTASLFRLDGRTAIITGGTRGIGLAIAEGMASAGAQVVVASRKADACASAEHKLRHSGHEALGVACHMGEMDNVAALVEATVDRYGGVDIIVNNAANPLAEPLGGYTSGGFDKSFGVNVKGPIFLVQAALPHLRASSGASVINVASAAAWMPGGGISLYAAAKSALVSFTRSMAAELARDRVRVNALAPGTVDTEMVRNTGAARSAAMAQANIMRRAATPSEMIGPAIFLASAASSYVTGSVLHADGGMVTR